MKQAITNLTKEETHLLNSIMHEFNLDDPTVSSTQRYYRELRKLNTIADETQPSFSQQDLMKVSLLIAEKSQVLWNMRGERIRGPGISVSQIIKSCPQVDQILGALQMFLKHSKLANDSELAADLEEVVIAMNFGAKFAHKLETALQRLDFEDYVDQSCNYKLIFKSFSWVVFLDSLNSLSFQEEIKIDCLLNAVLFMMINRAFSFCRPRVFREFNDQFRKSKAMIARLHTELFNANRIGDIRMFKEVSNSFDDYFQDLLKKGIIHNSNIQSADFLSPKLIYYNYKKIDWKYQAATDSRQVDLRLLLSSRAITLTPIRYTNNAQISRQLNKHTFGSHKVLNYDIEEVDSLRCVTLPSEQIALPAKVMRLPTNSMKTPLICANTLTTGMELHNYINHKMKKVKKSNSKQAYEENLSAINEILIKTNSRPHQKHPASIYALFSAISEAYFTKDHPSTPSIQASLMSFAIEIITYADQHTYASSPIHYSSKEGKFSEICDNLAPSEIDLYLVCNFLQKFDSSMPQKLKNYLREIECSILNEQIWRSIPTMELFEWHLDCHPDDEDVQITLNALLLYIETQITRICSEHSTELGDVLELIQEQALKCMKQILLDEIWMLFNRHIDQFIICSIYLSTKLTEKHISFNHLIASYERYNPRNFSRKIITEVWVDPEENLQAETASVNIIEFYNKHFVPAYRKLLSILSPKIVRPAKQINSFANLIEKSHDKSQKNTPVLRTHTQEEENRSKNSLKGATSVSILEKMDKSGMLTQREKIVDDNCEWRRKETTLRARPSPASPVGEMRNTYKPAKGFK